MSTPSPRRRPGFTLVELILVMAIIALLASMAVAGFRVAVSARKKARAKGEVQALVMACENFKKTYGDYPCAKAGTVSTNSDAFRRQLLDQLVGRKVLKSVPLAAGGAAIVQIDYDDATYFGTGARRQKSFLNLGIVPSNSDAKLGDNDWRGGNPAAYEFRDPWDNAYGYRYRILNAAGSSATNVATGAPTGTYAAWKSSNFLIVCASNQFNDTTPLSEDEFWDPTGATPMVTSGIVPSTYFDDTTTGLRSDNIVNWQNN
jgi:prepilin-type N-terminal cleavage/methylation domain-containing protein